MKNLFLTLLFALVAVPGLFAQNVKKNIPMIIEDKNVDIRERSERDLTFGYRFTNNSDKTVAYVVLIKADGRTLVQSVLERGESGVCYLQADMASINPCLVVREMKIEYKDGTSITLYNLEDYFRSNLEKANLIKPEE